ncbi:(Fe-S)-binding protein [Geomesophilobacter sediminis]|uniref:(Fe-S)-binding protein n=1 Tax=Geomesophilobacter sediminis TaxID=2798584 RepID=A0A8J7LZ73_9BACT|nr:(Fe-S)-binding protein [Geomesophilobacter sediminis]MBJ6726262.1 (Fe-S)-binding protein [Geomesophilobacter sediminis]
MQIVFPVILTLSLIFFAFSCYRRLSLVTMGTWTGRMDRPFQRIADTLVYAIGQKRVMKRVFGLNHVVIFWAFLVLVLANGEFLVQKMVPSLSFANLPGPLYLLLLFSFDICSLAALVAVGVAALRRAVSPPFEEARTVEAYFILSMIAVLMVAYFVMHGAEIALGSQPAGLYAPVSLMTAKILLSAGMGTHLATVAAFAWWIHAVALLSFMNFLPYSKHMHILTAIPNVFFRSIEKPNTQPREEFVPYGVFGADSVEKLSWKDLLDSFSCTECGRCQDSCPGVATGKALNPRLLVHSIKMNLLAANSRTGTAGSLIGTGEERVKEEALWNCTSCGACMEACPVFIEHLPKVVKMRRHLVEMEAKFPEELLNLFENMEQRSNPWGMAPSERSKWSANLDVMPFEQGQAEYLLFVGCAGAFDARSKQVTVALTKVLDAAGVSYGVLGKEEKCCGESVRRLGNEYLFEKMALESVQQFQSKGVQKVITQCPHCFNTLKNDFRQYGLELQVVHHSELIDDLMKQGKLKPVQSTGEERVVVHDSCYLGRHNGVFDAPREVIRQATGAAPVEFGRKGENAFCCGAGGGRMWLEEHEGTPINVNRVKEAVATNASTVCVSCPFCMTMFEDGLKAIDGTTVRVKDIAEVVAEAI